MSPLRKALLTTMKRILAFGFLGGLLIALLKLIEYKFLVVDHAFEIYGGLVAMLFSAVGIWLGLRLTKSREPVTVRDDSASKKPSAFVRNTARQLELGITQRELTILELIAAGLSTREIAMQLSVSENTVKTHSSRLFAKLSARRRTQVVRNAKDAGLIP